MKRRVALVAILVGMLLLGAAVSVTAQQKRPMTPEDVIALKRVTDAQVSPDGKWVAYVVTTADMKEDADDADVWLVSTAGGDPVRLTTSKKRDATPRWSPDGKRIAFISAREEKPQIFLISPFGGEAERLTESKTAVQSLVWSPDGSRIAYTAAKEPTPDEEKKQKEKDDTQVVDKNFPMSRIWTIDVKTRKATELVKADYSASDPQWSPDGRTIAYVAAPTPKPDDGNLTDIWAVDVESAKTHKLTENPGPDSAPRWSPDGKQIAYLSRDQKNGDLGQSKLTLMAADGSGARELAPAFVHQPGAP